MQKLTCILLVDDDRTSNFLNRKLLERLAVADKVLEAHNGQEALNLLMTHCQPATPECPALLLLDIKMPVMNGFEFLEAYHNLESFKQHSIIIVVLTTSMHPHDVQRVSEFSVAGFINKPLTREHIDHILQKHFARHLPS